ncbi:hypothetical protein ACWDR5_19525 [Streptomyces koyangensis]
MRQIKDGAVSYDRSPQHAVTEFRSLAGGVTTWRAPLAPRRFKLAWDYMQREDFDHIDRLARGVDGARTLSLVDPLSSNLLSASQGAGLGAVSKWVPDSGVELFGGQFGEHAANEVSVDAAGKRLMWSHPVWPGYPVTVGMTLSWWVPGLVAAGANLSELRLAWYSAAGANVLITHRGHDLDKPMTVPVTTTVPVAYVRPGVTFGGAGLWSLGNAVLAVGSEAVGPPALGQDTMPVVVTQYTHAGSAGDGRYRAISLELVEVTNA